MHADASAFLGLQLLGCGRRNHENWTSTDPSVATVTAVPFSLDGVLDLLNARLSAVASGQMTAYVDFTGPDEKAHRKRGQPRSDGQPLLLVHGGQPWRTSCQRPL
jgi:hypothetical protein